MKTLLRNELIQKRKNLNPDEIQEKSSQIKKRLFSLDEFQRAQTLLFYVSYDNEVYTHEMIQETLAMKKQVVVPCTEIKKRQLSLSELQRWTDLTTGAYTILEPKMECKKKVPLKSIDLVIVPGVGFDLHGNRIGHGKGYYDSLLRHARNTVKIGLAFELQIQKKIPVEDHDVCVDTIITEKRIISCSPR